MTMFHYNHDDNVSSMLCLSVCVCARVRMRVGPQRQQITKKKNTFRLGWRRFHEKHSLRDLVVHSPTCANTAQSEFMKARTALVATVFV